jgi:voltage-gated potassium channel
MLDALWWGLATVTTVGYGDIVPVTQTGRWIGVGLIATGIICFVGTTALVSSAFFAKTRLESLGVDDPKDAKMDRILEEIALLRRELEEHRKQSA